MFSKVKLSRYLILSCILLSFIIDVIAFPFFDKTIAIHFDARGNVNGEFHKIIIFLLPILMILILQIKDSFGNKIFFQNDLSLTEPYKVIIGIISAIVCFVANMYIVIYNLKITTISLYYITSTLIMLLIILGLLILVNKKANQRIINSIILISIGCCFIFQILTIFFNYSILNWVSSMILILVGILSLLKYKEQ
ncbi:DUF1648 domain-containing protein [Thomasclavelia sp.]|uniref:DUF1648 domain-containing protein n=1 Tax=Thomasclavelia sp. TaxID=3025757 RepID=UPI0025DCEB4F|nr:DUF1648 domain-containing protein [Thomasclavelia sp.]